MATFRQRLIHIHRCRGMTWKRIEYLLSKDPELTYIFSLSLPQVQQMFSPSFKNIADFYQDLHSTTPDQTEKLLEQQQIFTITPKDNHYPSLLKHLYDPPWVLYYMGRKEILRSTRSLAVVGTRTPTPLGQQSITTLLPPLIAEGFSIVSGLAKGIDRMAHVEAIKQGGITIAVLGSGLNVPYPKENLSLFTYMSQHQLVLSEYPPDTPPAKWQFPSRNRIISGLAQGLLVVEAAEKSGSLISADQALEQGRDVFAVPGPIYSAMSIGTNYLIQQGAKLVQKAEDITIELS